MLGKLNGNRGITIISLIVTIVVLIILAGISIGMLTEENGLINQANNTKEQVEMENEMEAVNLAVTRAMRKDRYGNLSKEYLDKELSKIIEEEQYIANEATKGVLITFESGRKYIAGSDGNVKIVEERTGLNVGDYIDFQPTQGTEEEPLEYDKDKLVTSITGATTNTKNITQDVTLGIDSGYLNIGFSAITEKQELISGEVKLLQGQKERLYERANYRRLRRQRLRYRKPRFNNRISKYNNI